jgi:hypothetical protein
MVSSLYALPYKQPFVIVASVDSLKIAAYEEFSLLINGIASTIIVNSICASQKEHLITYLQ